MAINNPESLLYRVFFRLSITLAMREGEHYQLKIHQFKSDGNNIISIPGIEQLM